MYKPEPVKAANYDQIDRRIRALQEQSTALYENDEIDDDELEQLVGPINAEIEELINQLYI